MSNSVNESFSGDSFILFWWYVRRHVYIFKKLKVKMCYLFQSIYHITFTSYTTNFILRFWVIFSYCSQTSVVYLTEPKQVLLKLWWSYSKTQTIGGNLTKELNSLLLYHVYLRIYILYERLSDGFKARVDHSN